MRRVSWAGLSNRSTSSTAFASRPGSARRRSSCSGNREQVDNAVADEVQRRLVAGDVQQDHLRHDLFVVEHVAGVLGFDERR